MHLLHPEKVDPFISLAMLRDYLALAVANWLIEAFRLDQVSLCPRQLQHQLTGQVTQRPMAKLTWTNPWVSTA